MASNEEKFTADTPMDKTVLTQEQAEDYQRKGCYDLDSNFEAQQVLKSHRALLERVEKLGRWIPVSEAKDGEVYLGYWNNPESRSPYAVALYSQGMWSDADNDEYDYCEPTMIFNTKHIPPPPQEHPSGERIIPQGAIPMGETGWRPKDEGDFTEASPGPFASGKEHVYNGSAGAETQSVVD